MKDCALCGNRRHRYDQALRKHVRCRCLREVRTARRYKEAGGPTRYEGTTWGTFLAEHQVSSAKYLVRAAKALREGGGATWLAVHGETEEARQMVSALLLRAACEGDMTARSVDLPTAIDAEFEKGRGIELVTVDALILHVGSEPQHKWNRIVLEKLLRERWSHERFTALVTEVEPGRLGTLYKSVKIENAITRRFSRVTIGVK